MEVKIKRINKGEKRQSKEEEKVEQEKLRKRRRPEDWEDKIKRKRRL